MPDTASGRPAEGVVVSLYRLVLGDAPARLAQSLTDSDGRLSDLTGRPSPQASTASSSGCRRAGAASSLGSRSRSWDGLWARAREIAHTMPEPEQIELIDAHPRPAPRPARSPPFRSWNRDTTVLRRPWRRERIAATLARLNDAYERRFGFRFCTFVAGRSRAALVPVMEAALGADRDAEIRRPSTTWSRSPRTGSPR